MNSKFFTKSTPRLCLLLLISCLHIFTAQAQCTDPTANYQFDNSASNDDCCWFINIDNMAISNQITAVQVDNPVDCDFGAMTAFGGWTINNQSNTNGIIVPNTPFIQPGNYPQQFRVCLDNRIALPHFFDVSFLTTDAGGNYQKVCTNSYAIDCPISTDPDCMVDACFTPNYQSGSTYDYDPSCSTGNGTLSYNWDFGDGNTSTAMNPTHMFTSNQPIYTVCLITSNTTPNNTICKDTFCTQVDSPVVPVDTCNLSCSGNLQELVTNGDFTSGDVGFNSGLTSSCTCAAASYCVTTNANLKCNNTLWNPVTAQGGGNYLVIDGGLGSVWSQSVNVTNGVTYTFSFDYYPDISGDPSPSLEMQVGGNTVLTNIVGNLGTWSTFCVDWTATSTGPVNLDIRQINSVGFDDYGIDNVSFSNCCLLEVAPMATISICENESATLVPQVSGASGSLTYNWSPSASLNNPAIANPIASPPTTTTYTLTVTDASGCSSISSVIVQPVVCPCDNQVVNGDFENGNNNFTSALNNSCTCQAGSYCVTSDARNKCSNSLWQTVLAPDNTSNFLVVDGSVGNTIWSQNVSVINGSVYDFCFDYFPNVSGGGTPQLAIEIHTLPAGPIITTLGTTTGTNGSWQKVCFNGWNANLTGNVELRIRQVNSPQYSDFGIDNVQFGTCCELEVSLVDTMTICENDIVQLNPSISGAIGPVTYSWLPTTGLSNPNIANPTAMPLVQTDYILTVMDSLGCTVMDTVTVNPIVCPCDNQVINGDFENGNNNFTSALNNSCTCQAGSYCVTTDARNKCSNSLWQSVLAPTNLGNYLVVDGSVGNTIWSQNVNVITGSIYDFCFDYFPNVSGGGTPQLAIEIHQLPAGPIITTLGNTTGSSSNWQKVCFNGWNANLTGNVELRIRQVNSPQYSDFGIDNVEFGTCCELEVSLQDTTVCENELVQLNPLITGGTGNLTYNWTPTTGLSNPNISNPTLTANSTITYTLVVTDSLGCEASAMATITAIDCPCENAVSNGDFESGDTGFASNLTSNCNCQNATYCITSDARNKCNNSLWQMILAPSGSGDYMVIDGNIGMVWSQNVNLTLGDEYYFCFDYYPNISGGGTPLLAIEIYQGGLVTTLGTTTGTADSWQRIAFPSWIATVGGTAELRITQTNSPNFNDYGIDNIVLSCDSTACSDSIISGITDPIFSTSVLVFPNPANHEVTVQLGDALNSTLDYQLIDIWGRTLSNGLIPSGTTQQTIPLEQLSTGIFILLVGNPEEGYHREKILVQRQE